MRRPTIIDVARKAGVSKSTVSLVLQGSAQVKSETRTLVHAAMKEASEGALRGVLEYCDEPLVSSDFNHNDASAVYDADQTAVVDGGLIRIAGWYDNEWGFSHRMNDTAALMGSL